MVWTLVALFVAGPAMAANFDESVSGDLSGNQAAPSALALTPGANSIIGTVGGAAGGDTLDIVTLTVPAGFQLTSYVNAVAAGTQHQYLLGFQVGTPFVGSTTLAGSYVGLAHFGTAASNAGLGNPSGSATSTVGVDLLPVMNTEGLAVGASGFTPPLGAGTYTFVIGELTADLSNFMTYRFDLNVAPEPGSVCLLGLGVVMLTKARRRRAGARRQAARARGEK
jgi:hypothetical protein